MSIWIAWNRKALPSLFGCKHADSLYAIFFKYIELFLYTKFLKSKVKLLSSSNTTLIALIVVAIAETDTQRVGRIRRTRSRRAIIARDKSFSFITRLIRRVVYIFGVEYTPLCLLWRSIVLCLSLFWFLDWLGLGWFLGLGGMVGGAWGLPIFV